MDIKRTMDVSDQPFSDEVWVDVLRSVDIAYQQLVDHQIALEARNRELEGMRGFLTSVLAAMSDVLIVCGQEGQVLEINASCLELIGRDRETVVGTPVAELFAEEDRKGLGHDLSVLNSRGMVGTTERSLLTPDGPTPLELSATVRIDDRRRAIGAVLMGRPLGELRRAYRDMEESHRALLEAQSQLVHSEKLASLGRLLAGVAHELNNPISFVYGNAHALARYVEKFTAYFDRVEAGASRSELVALRRELKLDRAVKNLQSAVGGALEGAERVRDIVESLRRLSAAGTGQIERFDLGETARLATFWVVKGRATEITPHIDTPEPVFALGRPGHIQQVAMNLVQNAIDAMEGVAGPELSVSVRERDGRAVLEVSDRGPGISEEAAIRLFDPFFTTKPVGKGTGLGLSISYKIVEENGGTLSFANRSEGGAAFTLSLPMEEAPMS